MSDNQIVISHANAPGSRKASWLLVLGSLTLTACASNDGTLANSEDGQPEALEEPEGLPGTESLSPAGSLARISMALTGSRPSLEDLVEVTRDPRSLEGIVQRYLDQDGFGETMRDLHNEALKLRVPPALFPAGFAAVDSLAGEDVQRINVSVTEAPLRFIEHVIENDRPYTEIVTANYTLADEIVAKVWGLEYSGTGKSWEETTYADGRPMSGILSDSWFYTRHSSTFSNQNRGRANAVARGLLCFDFTDRQVEVDTNIDLADPEQVSNAIENNEACVSCHQTLDPLASHFSDFFPLYVPGFLTSYPFDLYAPLQGPLFQPSTPGYFGFPGADVESLGKMVAEDPRFSLCAVKRFYAYFHQIPLQDVPLERVDELQQIFTERFDAKALAKAIVLADDFLVSQALEPGELADRHALLKARPWQIARTIADLTGFRWDVNLPIDLGYGNLGRVDVMTDSLFGYETLAGGIDSVSVTVPSHTMNASASLVLRGLAMQAAEHVVESDFQFPSSAKLLTLVNAEDDDEDLIREQLSVLHSRLYGENVAADSEAVNVSYVLFQSALDASDDEVARAWKTTLFAMLQDVRLIYY